MTEIARAPESAHSVGDQLAERLTARADLLEQRLTALGAPFQEAQGASAANAVEPGDKLTIRLVPDPDGIWGTRELTVSEEGMITLPYVGEIRASGLTVVELLDRLVKYYKAGHVFEDPVFEILQSPRADRVQPMPPQQDEIPALPLAEPEFSNPEPTVPQAQSDPSPLLPESGETVPPRDAF